MQQAAEQTNATCPECGAAQVDGMTCWEQLGGLLAWEWQDPRPMFTYPTNRKTPPNVCGLGQRPFVKNSRVYRTYTQAQTCRVSQTLQVSSDESVWRKSYFITDWIHHDHYPAPLRRPSRFPGH
jgi:hypothetical protein